MMGLTINPLQPAKDFLSNIPKKKLYIYMAELLILLSLLIAGYVLAHRDITINDNGKNYHVKIIAGNVEKALKKTGIKINKDDLVEPTLKAPIKQGMTIKITRAFPVKVIADGNQIQMMTPYNMVGQILKNKQIKLGELDRVEPPLDTKVEKDATIKVIRVSVRNETKEEEVAYSIEKRDDNSMQKGQTKIIQQGQKGLANVTMKITCEDGKEVKREVINRQVTKNVVNSIVAVGTINYMIASRGETLKYSKVVRLYATAYTHTGHNTASGIFPYRGAVSVPPSIPLGTKLYIPGYGYATALDRGGAIKGDRIDLFFERNEVYGWRNQYVDVYFLE